MFTMTIAFRDNPTPLIFQFRNEKSLADAYEKIQTARRPPFDLEAEWRDDDLDCWALDAWREKHRNWHLFRTNWEGVGAS